MTKNLRFMIAMLSLVFCLTASAFGQETTGSIEGTVKDPTGAVVPNASVTIRNFKGITDASGATSTGTSQGFSRTVTADGDGFFRVLQVPPGVYTVTTAPVSGFGEARYENVQVVLGKITQLNIDLKAGGASAVVDVGTSDQPVDTTSSEVSNSINAQKIELLPKGVDFTSVLKASPGTRPDTFAGGWSVDGASNAENVFIIDGQEVTNYKDAGINGNNQVPFTITQEVQVKSSGFDAEYGGATGGVINVVTKGGSNDFRGEIGMQFRTSRLDGRPRPQQLRFQEGSGATYKQYIEYFDQPKPAYLHTFPTANFSGPIIKDRLWFFANWSPQIFDQTTETLFLTNQRAAIRTVSTAAGVPVGGRDTYRSKQTFEYDFLRLDAQPYSKLRLTGTYLWNPVVTKGVIPFNPVAFGSSDPAVNFGGSVGSLGGSALRNLQGGRNNSNNITGQAIWTPLENLVTSFRYSRGFLNERGNNYAVPTGNQYSCTLGTAGVANTCTTGFASPSTTRNIKDVSLRTTYEGDATVMFSAGGRHQVKGGYQRSTIFNDLQRGFSQIIFLCYGDCRINSTPFQWSATNATPNPAAIGAGALQRFGQFGTGSNLNQAIYIQDKWQPHRRLTLNLGVRVEKEDVPSFNQFPASFAFDWSEKVAPRLGFAFDLFGNGRTKVFGNFGKYYDRLKFHMAQGSFGGDFYRVDFFDILPTSGPFTNFTTETVVGNYTDPIGGACPKTGFIGSGLSRCQLDLRIASNDPTADPFVSGAIDPDVKPYQQRELTFGFEHQLRSDYVLRGRFTWKKLINAIEDAGALSADGSGEIYITGNPGEGLHEKFLKQFGYATPYAVPRRDYKAMELVLEKRLSNNYYFNLNYTLSRLYGNYSGLANSDETSGSLNGVARSSPGVNRNFDLPFIGFTAAGKPDDGRLATDRPHVFNAYGAYIFDWWKSKANSTEFSVFQTIQSGSPQTSQISFLTTTIFTERGDLGRTPTFTQTDFNVTHRYRFGRDNRFTLVGDLNVLNLFDEKNVLSLATQKSGLTIPMSTFPEFATGGYVGVINAFNRGDLLDDINTYLAGTPTALNRVNDTYGKPNRYQGVRQFRFGMRLQF